MLVPFTCDRPESFKFQLFRFYLLHESNTKRFKYGLYGEITWRFFCITPENDHVASFLFLAITNDLMAKPGAIRFKTGARVLATISTEAPAE